MACILTRKRCLCINNGPCTAPSTHLCNKESSKHIAGRGAWMNVYAIVAFAARRALRRAKWKSARAKVNASFRNVDQMCTASASAIAGVRSRSPLEKYECSMLFHCMLMAFLLSPFLYRKRLKETLDIVLRSESVYCPRGRWGIVFSSHKKIWRFSFVFIRLVMLRDLLLGVAHSPMPESSAKISGTMNEKSSFPIP